MGGWPRATRRRSRRRPVHTPRAQLALAAICMFLGIALVTQLRTYHTAVKTGLAPADQALVIGSLVEANAALRREVAQIENELDMFHQPESGASVESMAREIEQLRVATSVSQVRGGGVEVVLSGAV